MATIEESIEVNVPVRTAYNQWTQFEEFPKFMQNVDEVRQLDDTHLHWRVSQAGKSHEFTTEITEQHPDERVAWKTEDGISDRISHAGVVTFHRISDATTRVMVQMDWEPDGVTEKIGAALGMDAKRVSGDLDRFKELIEGRGQESGAWRGEVENAAD